MLLPPRINIVYDTGVALSKRFKRESDPRVVSLRTKLHHTRDHLLGSVID